MRLTGGQIVAEYLIKQGMPYVIAVPGHGNLALCDAFIGKKEIRMLPCMQEMCGAHMADGYYRVTGKPLAVFTSIGPGAINTAIGVANAYVDSVPMLAITGSPHTYLRGKGLLQEIERVQDANFARMLEPVVKRYWTPTSPAQLPSIMRRAFNLMMAGRRGPVLIDLPMDVGAEAADVDVPDPDKRGPSARACADQAAIEEAAALLAKAKRPVIVAGGGVRAAGAHAELREVAETLGAAVITTLMGKGSFPEDHELSAWLGGSKGTTAGNAMASRADVILAVGCRFADETASSYKDGATYRIPPAKLIQMDIDPAEIGKNYPAEVGVVGDARHSLAALSERLRDEIGSRDYRSAAYYKDLQKAREKWLAHVRKLQSSRRSPVTISRALKEIRDAVPQDAFVITSSGNAQAQLLQEFPFTVPGTCISAGGFSTMGFTLPAAIGVRLGQPKRHVVGIVGDGDFMMTMQEMATAKQVGAKVVMVVLNNSGWIAIKDLQMTAFGKDRAIGTDFREPSGKSYSPDFKKTAEAFGWKAERVSKPGQVEPAVKRALKAKGPALVEVLVNRTYPHTGSPAVGWWDVPIPEYFKQKRARYEKEREGEKI